MLSLNPLVLPPQIKLTRMLSSPIQSFITSKKRKCFHVPESRMECGSRGIEKEDIQLNVLKWDPAATYPPGPCPAKYFRR